MNAIVMKSILKVLKNFISPDQIKELAKELLTNAIDYKNTLPIDSEAGENQVAAMQWEVNGEIYTSIVFLNSDDKIVRYDQVLKVDDLVETLVNKL